jgi:hypothetical protein
MTCAPRLYHRSPSHSSFRPQVSGIDRRWIIIGWSHAQGKAFLPLHLEPTSDVLLSGSDNSAGACFAADMVFPSTVSHTRGG